MKTSRPQTHFLAVLLILGLCTVPKAEAVLIEADLFTAGDSLLTRDDATGLDWLDLTSTTNLSVNQILADVGGFSTLGFTHASTAQVTTLFLNSGPPGVVTIGAGLTAANLQPALDLMALIGITRPIPPIDNISALGFAGLGESGPGLRNK